VGFWWARWLERKTACSGRLPRKSGTEWCSDQFTKRFEIAPARRKAQAFHVNPNWGESAGKYGIIAAKEVSWPGRRFKKDVQESDRRVLGSGGRNPSSHCSRSRRWSSHFLSCSICGLPPCLAHSTEVRIKPSGPEDSRIIRPSIDGLLRRGYIVRVRYSPRRPNPKSIVRRLLWKS